MKKKFFLGLLIKANIWRQKHLHVSYEYVSFKTSPKIPRNLCTGILSTMNNKELHFQPYEIQLDTERTKEKAWITWKGWGWKYKMLYILSKQSFSLGER